MRKCTKVVQSGAGHRRQYDAYTLHATYLKLQIHSGCVLFIAFPLQQWLHERASMLRYTYITCLVVLSLSLLTANNEQRTRVILVINQLNAQNLAL